MKELLNTNSRRYQANMDQYLLECITSEDENLETLDQKINYAMRYFNRVDYQNNRLRIPNIVKRFADFLAGLPFSFDYSNYDILQAAARLHEMSAIPESKKEIIINGYFEHIATQILRRAKK